MTSAARDRSDGWSAFGSYAFTPRVAIFGRYDRVKPSQALSPATTDNYINAGVDYKPIAPLDFALVYKHERARHGLLATTNGAIGGPDHGSYDELGLFGQLAF